MADLVAKVKAGREGRVGAKGSLQKEVVSEWEVGVIGKYWVHKMPSWVAAVEAEGEVAVLVIRWGPSVWDGGGTTMWCNASPNGEL